MRLGTGQPWSPSAILFLLPAAILIIVVFAVPLVQTLGFSVTDWRGGVRPSQFIGIDNYGRALTSERVTGAMFNNIVLLVVIPIEVMLGVFVASILREQILAWKTYRFLVFVPSMISITICGYVWVFFLGPTGVINEILRFLHLGDWARIWLSDSTFSLLSVMLVLIWRDTGFAAILFYSRLLGVDESIYESASIDGAKRWQRMLYIDFGLLKNIITVFVVLMTIWLFSFVFNYIYVMTGGGPGYASNVMELEIWRQGFKMSQMGYAAAISVLLLVITMPVIILQVRLQLKRRSLA